MLPQSTVDATAVLLQATQSDAFSQIQGDALLSSSLWVNIALAGLSIALFVYMGRNVASQRARLIWGATLMIPLVSISGSCPDSRSGSSRCPPDTRSRVKRL